MFGTTTCLTREAARNSEAFELFIPENKHGLFKCFIGLFLVGVCGNCLFCPLKFRKGGYQFYREAGNCNFSLCF